MLMVTNNSLLVKKITNGNSEFEVKYYDDTYLSILERARDLIHINYKLLTHPLYGSVKPNETLYRTVLLKKENEFDSFSLNLIEETIETTKKFLNNAKPLDWPESIKDDFRVIDADIIENAIKSIY